MSRQLPLVLANSADFVKTITKPLDREQFRASANVALKEGKHGGRKLSLVPADIDDFAKTIKKPVDQVQVLINGGECL